MKTKSIITIVIVLFAFACSTGNRSISESQKKQLHNLIPDFKYDGKIVHFEKWSDNNGENVFIFTENETEEYEEEGPSSVNVELLAYHFVNSGQGFINTGRFGDNEMDCMFDNRARFIEEHVTITDLDNNGFSEITFAYRLGCTSELSPDRLVLIVLENGNMYTIEGTTIVSYGPGMVEGGDTFVTYHFSNGPAQFLTHAQKIWEKLQNNHEALDKHGK